MEYSVEACIYNINLSVQYKHKYYDCINLIDACKTKYSILWISKELKTIVKQQNTKKAFIKPIRDTIEYE